MKNPKKALIIFLAGITAFCVFKYASYLKERRDLLRSLSQIKSQVAALETQNQELIQDLEQERQLRQELSQENSNLRQDLKAGQDELSRVSADLEESRQAQDALSSRIDLLKAENVALREQAEDLNNEFLRVSQEKDSLNAKLSSIAELKKAIKELKIKMRKARAQIKLPVKGSPAPGEGNRGFLVKDGNPTSSPKIRIRVEAIPQSQK